MFIQEIRLNETKKKRTKQSKQGNTSDTSRVDFCNGMTEWGLMKDGLLTGTEQLKVAGTKHSFRQLRVSPQDGRGAAEHKIKRMIDFAIKMDPVQDPTSWVEQVIIEEEVKSEKSWEERWKKVNRELKLLKASDRFHNWSKYDGNSTEKTGELQLVDNDGENLRACGTTVQEQEELREVFARGNRGIKENCFTQNPWTYTWIARPRASSKLGFEKWRNPLPLHMQIRSKAGLLPLENLQSIFALLSTENGKKGKVDKGCVHHPARFMYHLLHMQRHYSTFLLRMVDELLLIGQLEQALHTPKDKWRMKTWKARSYITDVTVRMAKEMERLHAKTTTFSSWTSMLHCMEEIVTKMPLKTSYTTIHDLRAAGKPQWAELFGTAFMKYEMRPGRNRDTRSSTNRGQFDNRGKENRFQNRDRRGNRGQKRAWNGRNDERFGKRKARVPFHRRERPSSQQHQKHDKNRKAKQEPQA